MNYFEKHIGDYLKDTSHLSLLEHGVYNRLFDVYYTREGGIPDDQAARLIGARSRDERDALKSVLAEFFQLVDGTWHQARCDAEIARYQDKQAKAKRSAEARWGTPRSQSDGNANASADAMRTHSEGNAPRVRTPTRAPARPQSPDTSHQTEEGRAPTAPPPSAPAPAEPPPEANGHSPTPAGAVCRAMRQAGMTSVNPGDPRLAALLAQGATQAEFVGLAEEAVAKGKGFAWVLVALQSRRAEAAAIALAPTPQQQAAADPDTWTRTQSGVINRAASLGLEPWDGISPWEAYRRHVIARNNAGAATA